MKRRAFLGALGLLAAPLGAQAQPPTRIAFISPDSPSTGQHLLDAFRQGLRERGYVDAQNLMLAARWAEGRSERFPELIGELFRLRASVS